MQNSAGELPQQVRTVEDWLLFHRGLRLKYPDAPILRCEGSLDALGYRIRRGDLQPVPRTWRLLKARLLAAAGTEAGTVEAEKSEASVRGTLAGFAL